MTSRLAAAVLLISCSAFAELLALPPGGDNQRSLARQQIGPVTVSIEYSSTRVVRNGENRRGKIWGQLVPYGLTNLGPTCTQCPWRVGANENAIFTASHEVKVQGQKLPAGAYGVHMIPGKDEWTVIFSKNSSSWGSFSYDPKEDALRVQAKPAKAEYHEFLTFEFPVREPTRAVMALAWEDLQVPLTISVDDAPALYIAKLSDQLRGDIGFDVHNLDAAANYALKSKTGLNQALQWAENAVQGEENFTTLMTLSRVQAALGKTQEAAKSQERAFADPSAKPVDIHQVGRQLLAEGKREEAMKIFQLNAQKFPNRWPVHVGLMRGYSAMGDLQKALAEARLARDQAPDEANRRNLEQLAKKLEQGTKLE